MAKRQTRLVIKNNTIPNAFTGQTFILPSSLLTGEAIVNTADGIMMFSGVTSSSNQWTPAGTGTTANFFEVGSNLYDLRLRNRITKYEGQSGANLVGKFLSGTTKCFVLADISDIQGVDSYVTGATWNPNLLTLNLNNGKPSVGVTINVFSALTINGPLTVTGNTTLGATTATTIDAGTILSGGTNLLSIINSSDTFVTGGTVNYVGPNGALSLTRNDNVTLNISGFTDIHTTGATLVGSIAYFNTNDSLSAYTLDLSAFSPTGDTYVTGFTYANNAFTISQGGGPTLTATISSVTGLTVNGDLNVTGDSNLGATTATTIDAGTILSGGTDLLTIINNSDTFVTGFTYNSTNNTLTINRNQGLPSLTTQISTVSGLTVSSLGSNQVVYTTGSGVLTTESGFEYNDVTDLLTVGNIFVNNPSGTTANIGQGGLVIGSGGSSSTPGIGDLVVHGDLTVFGDTTTISTSELYIEDPQITLNYNPTGDTSVTSIGSGILIQDGGGVSGQDAKIGIGQLFGSSISGDTSEYTAATGFENRGWVTQLNDIVIRNSSPVNFGDPDGVRVLAEGDILSGGEF